jgi:hypothetical protein
LFGDVNRVIAAGEAQRGVGASQRGYRPLIGAITNFLKLGVGLFDRRLEPPTNVVGGLPSARLLVALC